MKKNKWILKKSILFILWWFFVLSITQWANIPGLTLIKSNIWNAIQYIKQSVFTSSGINSWTKLMDINASSWYIWINTWLLYDWNPLNQKVLSLDNSWYLIYSNIISSPNYYVNSIDFDSWTQVLTLNISWVWPITWSLEWIQWPQGEQGIQWPKWNTWDQGNTWAKWDTWEVWPQWIQWNTWATWPQGEQGIQWATWAKWDTWEQWPQWPQWNTWATGAQWIQGVTWAKWDTWATWLQGIQWPKWNTWATGIQGIQGVTWATWPQGEQGIQWPKWDTWSIPNHERSWTFLRFENPFGWRGNFINLIWPKWNTGEQGIQWTTWAKWDTWATWPQWIQWFQGEQWPQWIQWNTWATGATWAKWDTWATWPQGEQGIQWATWAKWDTWEQWPQWPQWNTWATGIQGIQGVTWAKWDTWAMWATGAQGIQGVTWATWPQGEQGIQWPKWDTWSIWGIWPRWHTWDTWPQWPQGITGAQGATWPAGPSLDRYLTGISFDINTNLLTLYVSGATTLSTTIDSYRRLWQSNYIYNYNTGQKVLIWNQTWAEPETQVEIRNNSWYNLLLKNYSSDVGAVAWLWFWVQNQPWFKAGIIFQSIDSYGRGELILWLNNDTQTQQQSIIDWDAIMRLKHVWETGAVGILKSPEIQWVALDINDTMRLEPRSEVPFDCTEETLWSIFFIKKLYKEVWYAYPCFCGYLDPNSEAQEYEWLAMGRWDNVQCLAGIWSD